MELFQVEITGFKKFRSKSSLKTRGKVLAVLGANEAGKSSLLKALERLDDTEAFQPFEISRGADGSTTTIKATYLLTPKDREAAGLSIGTWYDITKASTGKLSWSIRPTPPDRDYSHRPKLITQIGKIGAKARQQLADEDEGLFQETDEFLRSSLSGTSDLSDEKKQQLEELVSRWRAVEIQNALSSLPAIREALVSAQVVETAKSQRLEAGRILWERQPEFLFFSAEDRDLRSSYQWTELAAGIPAPLANLAKVAELDLQRLISIAAANPNDPEFDTIMERANATLKGNFQAAWNQSKVSVVLAHREQSLLIQVYNNDGARTDFAHRSDGLRQFVALRCFTAARETDNFILLIDEAEQHLHYDAQADLVQMFASQTVVSKIIYTTHSVGCLPEDLGNGVRLVLPSAKDSDWSRIENKFWSHEAKTDTDDAAFSSILMGMGASTMAFFPTRSAILVEGPADAILLPTMFRELLAKQALGVQFVHGLSEDGHVRLPLLNSTGKRVCYLLDNDEGGRTLKDGLILREVEKDRVFLLPSSKANCELEDFVDAALLAEAASNVAQQHLAVSKLVSASDLPKFGKWDFIMDRCKAVGVKPLDKVPVAYEVLELLDADPGRRVVDAKSYASLKSLAEKLLARVLL